MKIKEIKKGKKLIALIIPGKLAEEGTNFYTENENPLQIGKLIKKKGVKVDPHIHKKSKRVISQTQEIIYIEKGKVSTTFYDEKGDKVKSAVLNPGDTVLLVCGGHSFNFLKDSKALCIKQGPYHSIKEDKSYFK